MASPALVRGGASMSTAQAPREYRDLVEQAKAAGWVLEPRRKHLQLRSPDDKIVVIPKTASDHRGPVKARADLQRAGLVLRKRRDEEPATRRVQRSDAKSPSELEVVETLSVLGRATAQDIVLRLGLRDDAIDRTRVRLRQLVARGVVRPAGSMQPSRGAPRILYAVASEPEHHDERPTSPEDGTQALPHEAAITAHAAPEAPSQQKPTAEDRRVVAAATELLRTGLPPRSIPPPAWRALGEACLALATFCEEMAK